MRAKAKFDLTVLTQDWHPSNHVSFYENNKKNPKAALFQVLDLPGVGPQVMWPVHCVQGSHGAEFHHDLKRLPGDVVVQKGSNARIDSYSGFFDNDHKNQTEMEAVLKRKGVTDVVMMGVATDYCVGFSALDALQAGFKTTVVCCGRKLWSWVNPLCLAAQLAAAWAFLAGLAGPATCALPAMSCVRVF